MPVSSGRTVFVLGRELDGNREVVVVEDGDTYDLDYDTIGTYTDQDSRFPYEV
jgi:hypothetical protein